MKPYIVKVNTNYKKVVRVDKVVAMILYKLAFGHSDRVIDKNLHNDGLPYKDIT